MKKAFLFMLAVLCTCAVQAVTVKWSGTTGIPVGTFSYAASSRHSLVATFTASGTGVLFLAGQEQNYNGNKNNSIRIERNANGTIELIVRGGAGTAQETRLTLAQNVTTGEEHKVAYAFDRLANGTTSNLDVYFDGEKVPRLKICFADLFSGKVKPFVRPLCANEVGGYYCYFPFVYERSLKIAFTGKKIQFHQIQYRSLEGRKVETYVPENTPEHAEACRLLDILSLFETIPEKYIPPTSIMREFLGESSFDY